MEQDCRSDIAFVAIPARISLDGLNLIVQSFRKCVCHTVDDGIEDSSKMPLQCFPRRRDVLKAFNVLSTSTIV